MASLIHRLSNWGDHFLCKIGVRRTAAFDDALGKPGRRLYAGRVSRGLPQYGTHIGMTPYFPNAHNIDHDITAPLPIPDNSVQAYQSKTFSSMCPRSR